MLSDKRTFHSSGILTLKKGQHLPANALPKDDLVNWLFLKLGDRRFSFVYKMQNADIAEYGKPVPVGLAFTMIEAVKEMVKKRTLYEVLRGEECIGTLGIVEI